MTHTTFDTGFGLGSLDAFAGLDDYLLPAPDARERLPYVLSPADQHRVDLHTALTAAGIPPGAGDTSAIDALSLMDATTVSAVIRWVNSRAGW
ncbi:MULTISPECIES: hypothetical protein [Streptomyces]|uniref:Uncharacterized protein n=1 Tax=Streptomyces solicathayae TaxID=3081768 RepID=A0ABZ0LP28_9ACTN|nr:hypothetical protein [Streptomyces sp. HUAS YS2]WOX21050.1 hypothetical protein R2D22_06470 [Streptomyces sp. HUAS YS2]